MLGKRILAAVSVTLSLVTGAFAQQAASSSQSHPDNEKGFVSFAEFGGSASSDGHVLRLNTSVGYNLTDHFGADFGVPFYFVGGSSTSATGAKTSSSGTGMGAPYFDVRWMFKSRALSYAGTVTDSFPAGSTANGLSTGQWTVDWNNRFEHSFNRLTPFAEIGIANTVADTSRFKRPYLAYGLNVHLEGGASFDITDKLSVGGSAYEIAPWGTQTIYSRTLPKGAKGLSGNGNPKQVYTQNSVTTGTSDLSRDHGFSAWGDYSPAPYVTAELGYTRSVSFALNSVSFGLRFNLGYLMKKSAHSHN